MKLKDIMVENYVFQAINRSILETILNKQIWESMEEEISVDSKGRSGYTSKHFALNLKN